MLATDLVLGGKKFLFLEEKASHFFKKIKLNKKLLFFYNTISQLEQSELDVHYRDGFLNLTSEPMEAKAGLKTLIEEIGPWRKGPYKINELVIDSEWKSNLKWDRIKKVLPSLNEKVILDIGCNNGYFMFHLLRLKPSFVMGLDPVGIFFLQYFLISKFLKKENMDFSLLGHEELSFFDQVFDVVLCLGILYHHPDPLLILKKIHRSLKPGGLVLLDCQGIADGRATALFPKDKYLGKSNFWFLPSPECLKNWLFRTGFNDVEIFYQEKLSSKEQRKTALSPNPSLAEGMRDDATTLEGYPYPYRFYVKAFK